MRMDLGEHSYWGGRDTWQRKEDKLHKVGGPPALKAMCGHAEKSQGRDEVDGATKLPNSPRLLHINPARAADVLWSLTHISTAL